MSDTKHAGVRLTGEMARFVVERTAGYHESAGPYEGGKIGFALGERVFWTDSYVFPGDTTASHAEKVAYVTDIIMSINAGRLALSQSTGGEI